MRELRYDAGTLALNLVATVGRRLGQSVERLDSLTRLAEWFEGVDLPVDPSEVGEPLLAAVRRLREAEYSLLTAIIAGTTPDPDTVAMVNAKAGGALPAPRLVVDGTVVGVAWAGGPAISGETALTLLARDLLDHLRCGGWLTSLRVCAAAGCGMIFVDGSQGKARRWCSMETCGNRAKAALHRTRITGVVDVREERHRDSRGRRLPGLGNRSSA